VGSGWLACPVDPPVPKVLPASGAARRASVIRLATCGRRIPDGHALDGEVSYRGVVVTSDAQHWDAVYTARPTADLSWYQAQAAVSMKLISRVLPDGGSVVDVGAGASVLADALINSGCTDITILDLSTEALEVVRRRLPSGVGVTLAAIDVLDWRPARTVDVWHDRAVFHFLVNPSDRMAYVQTAQSAVGAGGALVIGTFAADGPESCSGLPTARYGALELAAEFAEYFELQDAEREQHLTPWGAEQPFTWVVLRRV